MRTMLVLIDKPTIKLSFYTSYDILEKNATLENQSEISGKKVINRRKSKTHRSKTVRYAQKSNYQI